MPQLSKIGSPFGTKQLDSNVVGPQGPQGIQGEKGDTGDTGAQGDPGMIWEGEFVGSVTIEQTGTTSAFDVGSTTYVGQSFTPASDYDLKTIAIKCAVHSSFNLTVNVYATDGSGLPTGSTLGTDTQADAADVTFTFGTPISLTGSTKYVFVISSDGPATDSNSMRGVATSGYAGGNRVFSTDSGSSYSNAADQDLYFIMSNQAGSYTVDDVVQYNGSSYICIQDTSEENPTNPAYWELVAQAGEVTTDSVDTLTNKTVNLSSNTLSGTQAEFDTACSDGNFVYTDDIGVSVQAYDADTAKYDDVTANFTGTLQNGGSNVIVDTDIGSTVQGYDADTAKYDDVTANFTGTLQNGGSNVVVDTDIGSTVQAYDANNATASSTTTFTNKTFDANGTGNSISNIDVADLANGTDGELITWDAAGAPAIVATGTSGQILTSNGAGAAPTFQDAAAGGDGTQGLGLNTDKDEFSYTMQVHANYWSTVDCTVYDNPGHMQIDSSNNTWQATGELQGVSANTLAWSDTGKTTTIEFRHKVGTADANDQTWGLTENNFFSAYNSITEAVCFSINGSTLYARTADGSTATTTDISSGITVTNWNVYKIIRTPGTNALFYVNGDLKATHTTNLPSTGTCRFGWGGTTNGQDQRCSTMLVTQKV